ncbi:hypothetical protein BH11PLA1_BH11PLA1_19280 [soil metagenome]
MSIPLAPIPIAPHTAFVSGVGPFNDKEIKAYLIEVSLYPSHSPSSWARCAIVGRAGTDLVALGRQLAQCQGKRFRVYSHEMLEAWVEMGQDPFECMPISKRLEFVGGHPVLLKLLESWTGWVVCDLHKAKAHHSDAGRMQRRGEYTPLSWLGYSVNAKRALSETSRREILAECFISNLPEVAFQGSLKQTTWGSADSGTRLKAMATELAQQTEFHARRYGANSDPAQIKHSDLEWLREQFYNSSIHDFHWPT